MNAASTQVRMTVVLVVLLAGLVAVPFRAYWLGVVAAEDHLRKGGWRTVSETRFEGPRGAILDRRGSELARNALSWQIAFDPRHFFLHEADRIDRLIRLFEAHDIDTTRLAQWAAEAPHTLPRHVVLLRDMAPSEADALGHELAAVGIRAVTRTPAYRRVYPQRDLAGHTLGFARRDGTLGLAGVESLMDDALRGRPVAYRVERDSRRSAYLFEAPPDFSAASGDTVMLTIDAALQRRVEDELALTLREFEAEAGTVIVSRPSTGEILALASLPSVDPNRATHFPQEAWLHPAVAHVWEPGSTAKVFTYAAALEQGLLRMNDRIDAENGRYRIGGHWVRDTQRSRDLAVAESLARSSNIAAVKIGMRLSPEAHRDHLLALGFGQPSGVGLSGDGRGLLRALPWRTIEQANVSFGHGFAATHLQLHMAIAAIANEGNRMVPRIVHAVLPAGQQEARRVAPEVAAHVYSPQSTRAITELMIASTEEGSTGTRARVPGFRVAGKTGTAELWDSALGAYGSEYLSSFVGFAPAEAPEVVVTVQILRPNAEIGYFGGAVAAPLFSRVTSEALASLGIYPASDGETPQSPPSTSVVARDQLGEGVDAESLEAGMDALGAPGLRRGAVPDFRGHEPLDAIHLASMAGFEVELRGTGVVRRQYPAPGETEVRGARVLLELGDPRVDDDAQTLLWRGTR